MMRNSDQLQRPKPFETIVYGGLTIGILDGIFALVFYGLMMGVSSARIFQTIASGLLGRDSYGGGMTTVLLGIVLHFVVATMIAVVYYLAALKIPFLTRQAVLSGLIYGMAAYLVMNYLVIPLSRADSSPFNLTNFLVSIIGHAFLVGLPVALIARWSASKSS